jgi:hypothetical protein
MPLMPQKVFVLHDKHKLMLQKKWYNWTAMPWTQPVHAIRAYFVRGSDWQRGGCGCTICRRRVPPQLL